MKGISILAIALIVVGILALAYGGFTYTERTHEGNLGPIEMSIEEKETVNIPIWAGVGAIVIGGVLLLVDKKSRS